jgi:gamma-glutamylcyclotransferase (GGCT)/AIG2-like uncharacterized protein YtfP
MALLFVYGSLMRGEANHGRMGGAPLLQVARTAPEFTLVDLGPYPAMLADGTQAVTGELYEVDLTMLAGLDRFEAPYGRTTIRLEGGREAEAYVLPRGERQGPTIVSGDWRRRGGPGRR